MTLFKESKVAISKKPILITGIHRSGTTWVGKMIAESPSVGYIHEPFSLLWCRSGICGAKFDYWFQYISDENESIYYEQIKKTINFSYNLIGEVKEIRCLKDVLRLLGDYGTFLFYRISNVRPLIKDPIAVFSAEWLASKFDMNVIVMIRHPAAFAYSLKRKNWTFRFSNFLKQPLLMKDHLYPFEDKIKEYADKEHDIIDQAALLWNIIHHTIIKYKKKHNDWIFLRHEDIAENPISAFQTIFRKLDIEYSKHIRDVIEEFSNSKNPIEQFKNNKSLKRDSKSSISNWKTNLAKFEIDRIRAEVEDISIMFYSDDNW